MEISLLQLFWLVLIIVIFAASAIKRYLSNKKSKDRLSRENVREREEVERRKPGRQQSRSEWEKFMSDMFGVEPIKIRTERPPKKRREPTEHIEIETKEEHFEDMSAGAAEPKIQELHATIEDRHIKSEIEEDVIKPSISEAHITPTIPEYGKEYKAKKRRKRATAISRDILRKEGLKNAIIYSEIIGPPIGLRKRSLLRHLH